MFSSRLKLTRKLVGSCVLLLGMACANSSGQSIIQTYYIPFPEDDVLQALQTIDCFGCGAGTGIGDTMRSTISIVPGTTNTIIYYDHWEDGYEDNIIAPTQSTSQIWGNGNASDGIPPSFGSDFVHAGDVITLLNDITVPRNASIQEYDGRDKFAVTRPVAITRAMYAIDPGEVLAGAAQAYDSSQYGFTFRAPVGTDTGTNNMYEYATLLVMASQDGTILDIDVDNDGTFETTVMLDQGETYLANYVAQGATVQASRPIQAHEITGDIGSNYEMRWFTLFPEYQWDTSYYAPVGTRTQSQFGVVRSEVVVFNPGTNPVNVSAVMRTLSGQITTNIFEVTNNATASLLIETNSGVHVYTTNGQVIIPIVAVDAGTQEEVNRFASTGNQDFDWGIGMLPEDTLTTMSIAGWGQGSGSPAINANPVWVTAISNTTVYVDLDSDPSTGPLTDPLGFQYDYSTNINALSIGAVYDPVDNDQTGMRLYTVDGSPITTAWGEDGNQALYSNPYLDMGTSILPFPTVLVTKRASLFLDLTTNGIVESLDALQFAITVENVGFATANDVTLFDSGASNTTYVTNTYVIDGVTNADDVVPPAASFFPLDEGGANIGNISVGETVTVSYVASINSPYPTNAGCIVNQIFVESDRGNRRITLCEDVPRPGLRLTKSNDPDDSVLLTNGAIVTYTIFVENTGDVSQTGVRVTDAMPEGVTYIPGSTLVIQPYAVSNYVRNEFNAITYSNDDGNITWEFPWQEVGEADGANAGDVLITGDGGVSPPHVYTLQIEGDGGTAQGVYRQVNIQSYTSAVLSFEYRRQGMDNNTDYVAVYASSDGGTNWTELARYGGTNDAGASAAATDASYRTNSFNLAAYISPHTAIRFLSANALDANDFLYVDNIELAVQGINVTNSGFPPPQLIDKYTIPAGTNLTVQFQVQLDNPPTITQAINIACVRSFQTPTPVCDDATNNIDATFGLFLEKTNSPGNGVGVNPGDIINYTITLVNTGDIQITSLDLTDVVPDGSTYSNGTAGIVTYVPGGPTTNYFTNNNVREEWNAQAYDNQDGTDNWLADWVETDPAGSPGPVGDYVGVTGNRLFMHWTFVGDETIERSVDLSGADFATWIFDWETVGLDAGETMSAMVATNDGGPFVTLATFGGTASGTTNFDISSYMSADTTIRFENESSNWENGEYFYADNITIEWVTNTVTTNLPSLETNSIAGPPNLLSDYDLEVGETVVVVFAVTVDDPATALKVINTACVTSDQQEVEFCDTVTNPVIGATAGMTIDKQNDPTGTVDPGDSITYTITLVNTGTIAQTSVTMIDDVPLGTTYSNGSSLFITYTNGPGVSNNVRDEFNAIAFTNNDGSVNWNNDWQEVGEANGAGGNAVRVQTFWGTNYQLKIYNSARAATREVDLSGATNAVLSFDYRISGFDAAGEMSYLNVSSNGGASWVQLDSWAANVATTTFTNYDITAYASANTTIIFSNATVNGGGEGPELDDIEIAWNVPGPLYTNTVAGSDPPNLLTNYTLGPGSNVTIQFVVTVDDPPTATQLINQVCVTSKLVQTELCDEVTNNVNATRGLLITKTADLVGNWQIGGTNTYTITVINTGTLAETGATLTDALPDDTAFVPGSAVIFFDSDVTNTMRDDFSNVAYINNDGTINWAGAWVEDGDDGLAGFGNVQVNATGDHLRIENPTNGLYRLADTTLGTNITLSFDFRRLDFEDANDYVAIYASSNGGAEWVIVDTLAGAADDAAFLSTNYNLTAFIATNTAVRFISSSATTFTNGGGDTDQFILDAVQIQTLGNAVTGNVPPTLFSGLTIPGSSTVTVQFATTLDPPVNYLHITNTACITSEVQLVDLCASVTNPVQTVDVGVLKSVSDSTPTIGETVYYEMLVTNNSTQAVSGVVFSDILPTNVTYEFVTNLTPNSSYNNGSGNWTIGDMAVGGIATMRVVVTVISNDAQLGIAITNTVNLLAIDLPDTVETNNQDEAVLVPAATLAVIGSFRAFSVDEDVIVEWETVSEVGTAGFNLLRRTGDAGFVRVNDSFIPGLHGEPQGGVYRVVDEGVEAGSAQTYKLVEVEMSGRKRKHGPYHVVVDGVGVNYMHRAELAKQGLRHANKAEARGKRGRMGKRTQKAAEPEKFDRQARRMTDKRQERTAERQVRRAQEKGYQDSKSGNLAKLPLNEEGLYYVTAEELADVLGLKINKVRKLIRKGQLEIREKGQQVSYIPAYKGIGLYIYGKGQDSIFTDEQVYWFGAGNAYVMASAPGGSPSAVIEPQTFTELVHAEEDVSPLTALFDDPVGDFWVWNTLLAGNPSIGSKEYSVELCGVSSNPATAHIAVHLHGVTVTGAKPEHHAVIWVNDEYVAEGTWWNKIPHVIEADIDQSLLVEGTNVVKVVAELDSGVSFSVIAVDSIDVTYERNYVAKDNILRFSSSDHQVITVRGFTESFIVVLDVTDEHAPKMLSNVTSDGDVGDYRVSFAPAGSDRTYLAFTPSGIDVDALPLSADATALTDPENRADYIVITPGELALEAQELADYRASQGYEVMLVELQDVYDTFAYGEATPLAIKEFLDYAYTYWELPPRYAVLIGTGTYDYKDAKGYGDNLVPTLMVTTPYGLFASDMQFGDVVDNDGVPEIAVGRIPVLTAPELTNYIAKVMAYEASSGAGWSNKVVWAADNPDNGGDFTSDSESLSIMLQSLTSGYTEEKAYLENDPVATARQTLTNAINSGAVLVNYLGHGGMDRMAGEGLMLTADVEGLHNQEKAPLVLAMTCILGRYEVPGFDTLGEALVVHEKGGAIATWSPTGLSLNHLAKILNEEFHKGRFEEGETVLGELILRAFEGYADRSGQTFIPYIYNLLGDPATQLK